MQGNQYQQNYRGPTGYSTWRGFGVRTQKLTYDNPSPQGNTPQQQQQQQQPRIDIPASTGTSATTTAPKTWKDFGVTIQNSTIKTYQSSQPSSSKAPTLPPPPTAMHNYQLGHEDGKTFDRKKSPPQKPNFNVTLRVIDSKTVEYEYAVLEPASRDWVGLYIHDTEHNYKGRADTRGSSKGRGTFQVPSNGYYDVRYMRGNDNGSYLAKSNPVLIGPKVTLKVEEDEKNMLKITYDIEKVNVQYMFSDSDWEIGIYPAGRRSNNKAKDFYKCRNFLPGEVDVQMPREPGKYDVRFFLQSTHAYSAMDTFEVLNTDKMEATRKENIIMVKWVCKTKSFSERNWVGLYREENPSKCVDFRWVSQGEVSSDKCSGSLYFQVDEHTKGRYFLTYNVAVYFGISNTEVREMRINVEI